MTYNISQNNMPSTFCLRIVSLQPLDGFLPHCTQYSHHIMLCKSRDRVESQHKSHVELRATGDPGAATAPFLHLLFVFIAGGHLCMGCMSAENAWREVLVSPGGTSCLPGSKLFNTIIQTRCSTISRSKDKLGMHCIIVLEDSLFELTYGHVVLCSCSSPFCRDLF